MKCHFVLPWAMLSILVFVIQPLIKSQTHGKINVVGGGIDVDEREAIQVVRGDYNLSLLFLKEGTEEYPGGREGNIKDANGNSFSDTVSDGRMLFPEFKPGRYRHGGGKIANVGGKTRASPSLPRSKTAEYVALDVYGR